MISTGYMQSGFDVEERTIDTKNLTVWYFAEKCMRFIKEFDIEGELMLSLYSYPNMFSISRVLGK